MAKKKRKDQDFLDWLTHQPSCVSGNFDWIDGEPRCVAAHVKRAKNSGTGFKPVLYAVPLTDAEHKCQHQHGETGVLERYSAMCGSDGDGNWEPKDAKEFFNRQAEKYRKMWIKHMEGK